MASPHTHVTRRAGGVYYFRLRVPADLLEHYAPKVEIVFSLRTKDRNEASRKAAREFLRLSDEFDEQRKRRDAEVLQELSGDDIDRLASLWHAHLLEEDEEYRTDGLSKREFAKHGESLDWSEAGTREGLARGDFSLIEFEVTDFLAARGIRVDPQSPSYRKLLMACAKSDVRATEAMQARHRGEVVDTPTMPTVTALQAKAGAATGPTLADVLTKFNAERKLPAKTLGDYQRYVEAFTALHGPLPVKTITKSHAVAFKDALVTDAERALSAKTINEKYLAMLRALLNYATDNGLTESNPFLGVKVRAGKISKRSVYPYSRDELRIIFASPIYTGHERPAAGAGEAAFWLPLLALFTGAREEELGQLRVAHVSEESGVACLVIDNQHEGSSIKNESSRRSVPIHPQLQRIGFLEYVASLPADGFLFPALRPDCTGKRTGNWSKWWGRWCRQRLGITDETKVFHSFRHLFKDGCRNSMIPDDVHSRLSGHATSKEGDKYGTGHAIATLNEWLAKLTYPELDLSGIHWRAESE